MMTNNKNYIKIMVALIIIGLLMTGCNNIVKPEKQLGEAGKTVQQFFKNWKYEQYKKMHKQTIFSRSETVFIKDMEETPIQYQNLNIISEKQTDTGWDVTISFEITDLTCTFVACLVNLKYNSGLDARKPGFLITPELLEIQQFMSIKQTWKVVENDNQYLIDLCAAGSDNERHSNIMNYVLDASLINILPPSLQGSSDENMMAFKATAWLAMASLNLGLEEEETKKIIDDSLPLYRTTIDNLEKLINDSNEVYK